MSVHRTVRPRAWTTAAAAAFIAGLPTTDLAVARPPTSSTAAWVANAILTPGAMSTADAIGLRPDPANPGSLVVDFGNDSAGRTTFDRTTFSAISTEIGTGNDRFSS